ncbi:nucleolar protein 9 [Protopterus annectens]|uniref:nucleolar protein 9 n=1 Tax=Protopterus annectens TaxID=7888 RepID=UPI001CF9D736|nr:nucleolar protein 9 [Protopterus annectens]XP_043914286.1 nucleolar protein 9 [Protopterus annectens]XP_043914287.1 nucleolar protein 9 [Protopterus annectens]XP_043914288.1 nucleolar protein 9 [Protopterus annectens]XP_043914289.1 nucleolar protein 9 [Protopterus annectens]XP_043914290.1 nucleolar protein 9 [Protopterus annectens]XP_043914292.1 nucleolar protein 9 [Protopterus annectens]XP_043914293.1 nucleolar protein 9 [Protopterus annectens]XP_043914294.1 nucleolar protein 9 [Protopt
MEGGKKKDRQKKSPTEKVKLSKTKKCENSEEEETAFPTETEVQECPVKAEEEEEEEELVDECTERKDQTAGRKRKKKRGPRKNRHSDLDPQTVSYFQRVVHILKEGFSTDEERALFVTNVFAEVSGKEVSLSSDQLGSVVLEKLLPYVTVSQLYSFLSAFSSSFEETSHHRCAAHVIETALRQIPHFHQHLHDTVAEEESSKSEKTEGTRTLEDVVLHLCATVKVGLVDFCRDIHASFVVRTLVQVLAGIWLNTSCRGSSKMQDSSYSNRKQTVNPSQVKEYEPPESFLEQLLAFSTCVQENIQVFVTDRVTSYVFQVMLQTLQRRLPDACNELCTAVVNYLTSRNPTADSSSLLIFLKDHSTSHLLEKVLEAADKKLFKKLYKCHLKGHLLSLSLHEVANFTVQRVISAAPTAKLFVKLFDELCPGLEGILAKGHMGVITQLTLACVKHRAQQENLLNKLMEAFHCAEPPSRQITCAPLFLSLLAYEVHYALSDEDCDRDHQPCETRNLQKVNYHGSVLVQHLLQFEDPTTVLISLMAMSEDDLVTLACDPGGSHVFDVLISNSNIPEKRKKKFLGKLKGHYVQLACSKHGSRVLDQIWKGASLGKKQDIAQELVAKEEELRRDTFGHHIVRNFALAHFQKRRRDWDEHQAADSKLKKMFLDILED